MCCLLELLFLLICKKSSLLHSYLRLSCYIRNSKVHAQTLDDGKVHNNGCATMNFSQARPRISVRSLKIKILYTALHTYLGTYLLYYNTNLNLFYDQNPDTYVLPGVVPRNNQ